MRMMDFMVAELVDKIEKDYGKIYVPIEPPIDPVFDREWFLSVWGQAVELYDNPANIKNRTAARMIAILNERNN